MLQPDDPERALALVYAPQNRRTALAVLWRLDERLAQVLDNAHEPMIRAIRLAWWREALEALDTRPAPDEPLLQDVVAHVFPCGITGADLAELEAGWAALVDVPADLAGHAAARGPVLFALAARLAGGADDAARLADAGEGWALIDRLARGDGGDGASALRARALDLLERASERRWPRALRALGVLAALALRDARPDGLERRRPGSPARIWRALAMGALGR